MSKYLMVYTFVHEPSEIIINSLGSTEAKAREAIKTTLDHAKITMPEGKWEKLGCIPFEENY